MGITCGIISPDIIHKLLPGKNLSRKGYHFIQKHELLLRKNHIFRGGGYRQGIALQDGIPDPLFPLIDHLCSTKKGTHPQNQFIDINWFYHIIIRTGQKSHTHIIKSIFGGNHKYRNGISGISERTDQFIAVHVWHHNIRDDQIIIVFFQGIQCFLSVGNPFYRITVFQQDMLEKLAKFPVIFRNENFKHFYIPIL